MHELAQGILALFARPEPFVFVSRFTLLGISLAGSIFALMRLDDAWALPVFLLLTLFCVLGVIDLTQTKHAVRRN